MLQFVATIQRPKKAKFFVQHLFHLDILAIHLMRFAGLKTSLVMPFFTT